MKKNQPLPPDPRVYRLAAKRILEGRNHYCCVAIPAAVTDLHIGEPRPLNAGEYNRQFTLMFGPKGRSYRYRGSFWNSSLPRKEERAMALLMMAEICENPA